MGKRKRGKNDRARRAAARREVAVVAEEPVTVGRFDEGVAFFVRRMLSWLVDYLVSAGLVSVFYFCAGVFYLDPQTAEQGHLMLACAVVTVLLLTVYLPVRGGGQTLGERLLRVRVVNLRGGDRTYLQCFVRECVIKVALGPCFLVFMLLDYVILGLVVHREPNYACILDYFLRTRVEPAR